MNKIFSAAGIALLAGWAACGQAAPAPSFEVASVKSSAPGPWRESKVGVDRIDFPRVTLKYCLAFAYGVKEFQVTGPAWISDLKYDIVAKGPQGTVREQLPAMMQTLLAQRFKLEVHQETKDFNVYVLSVGRNGPKLKAAPPEAAGDETGAKFGLSMTGAGVGKLEAKNATMTSLAATLARMLGSPVIDQTEIAGRYDMDLEYSPEDINGMRAMMQSNGPIPVAENGISVFGSLQQFGLRLDARKVPMKEIVFDRAEKVPSEN